MSATHLSTGSVEPPRTPGLLRLYSNKYCPFVMRVRSVLATKEIPHDEVFIHLIKKPEWYLKIHPEGKVPALLDGDKVVIESLDICEYLEEKFPNKNPLYPSDPAARAKDKEFIETVVKNPRSFLPSVLGPMPSEPDQTIEDLKQEVVIKLQSVEDMLKSRGQYFGGDKPQMVDYVFWSFLSFDSIPLKLGGKQLPFEDTDIPNIRDWAEKIRSRPELKHVEPHLQKRWTIAQNRAQGKEVNYDIPLKLGGKQLPFEDTDIPNIRDWAEKIRSRPELKHVVPDLQKRWTIAQNRAQGKEVNYDI